MNEEVELMRVDGDPKLSALYWNIYDAARRGLDKGQIAKYIGVSKGKLQQWVDSCPDP